MRPPRRANAAQLARLTRRRSAIALGLALAVVVTACGGGPALPSPGATPDAAPGSAIATPGPVAGAPDRPTGPTMEATLVRVVDGDTIRALVDGVEERVRYIGMDTPEPRPGEPATPDPYAAAATEANARILAGGRLVLETDVSERDRYGRLLRHAWIERDGTWTLVGLALLAEGLAQVSTYPPDVKYVDAFVAAQRAARDAGRGLWGGDPP